MARGRRTNGSAWDTIVRRIVAMSMNTNSAGGSLATMSVLSAGAQSSALCLVRFPAPGSVRRRPRLVSDGSEGAMSALGCTMPATRRGAGSRAEFVIGEFANANRDFEAGFRAVEPLNGGIVNEEMLVMPFLWILTSRVRVGRRTTLAMVNVDATSCLGDGSGTVTGCRRRLDAFGAGRSPQTAR